jgi:transcriptional regulator with XRE-family HTH domain
MQTEMLTEQQAKENIAKNIRQLMSARAMTQVDLSAAAEISQGFVSKILQGSIMPSALLLRNIADVFSVSTDSLLDFPRRKAS